MFISKVSVSFTYTYNLGNYSNIRPEIQLSADIAPGENPVNIIADLQSQAMGYVHRQIDDCLERSGEPAKFSFEPRYSAYVYTQAKFILIFPSTYDEFFLDDARANSSWNWQNSYEGHRIEALETILRKRYPEFTLQKHEAVSAIDRLPEKVYWVELEHMRIVGKGEYLDVPAYIRAQGKAERKTLFWEDFEREQLIQAEADGVEFVPIIFPEQDIPKLEQRADIQVLKPVPKEELEEDIPFDEDEDDYDDYDDEEDED